LIKERENGIMSVFGQYPNIENKKAATSEAAIAGMFMETPVPSDTILRMAESKRKDSRR